MEANNNNLLHRLDRVILPLNRTYPCNHIFLYGQALTWSTIVPFTSITKEGRLCTRATLIREVVVILRSGVIWYQGSPGGNFLFSHDGGRCLEDTVDTQDMTLRVCGWYRRSVLR